MTIFCQPIAGRDNGRGPIRVVGRTVYNFLEPEKDFYYDGTKLGKGRTFALAGGFDVQGSYRNFGMDAFLDAPAGNAGSITVNAAYTRMTGGTGTGTYSFAWLIPRQNIQFLELGYYFKNVKLQPWIKYENQNINGRPAQFGLPGTADGATMDAMNMLMSNERIGGGLNYFFNDLNTNLRLSYTSVGYGREALDGGAEKARYNQFWLQLQLFLF
ncbi:hypothetical protein ACMA1I_07745 [Pontibacter sp. 13R65]|uniref:hypothetical protein n=1 Tax=Pontibacter sp. 13R65 TaxID=3127458 RepID=UPI00301BABEC